MKNSVLSTGKEIKRACIFLVASLLFIPVTAFAQSPEAMSYQAVIRDASGNLVRNGQVGMRISILQGSADGSSVYAEEYTVTTNDNGLVSLEIGSASQGATSASLKNSQATPNTSVSGDFSAIDWANGPYFIKVETDPTGGTNYTITGVSQLLSVPYALHAKSASNVKFTDGDDVADAAYTKGNVGIGTSAPLATLDVKGKAAGLAANIRSYGDIHLGYGTEYGGGLFFGTNSYSWATGDYIRQPAVGKLDLLAGGTNGTRLILDNTYSGAKIVNNGDAWLRIGADNDNSGGDDGSQNAYLQFTTDGGNDSYDGLIWLENLSGDTKLHFDVENQETMVMHDGNVGIKTSDPESELDVKGTLKIADGASSSSPKAGMIRWNSTTQDFEGFNGSGWVSLSKSNGGWGDNTTHETQGSTASDGIAYDYFGYSVSIDGNFAVVGANSNELDTNVPGKAYVFKRANSNNWIQVATLTPSDGITNDQFGYSVSVHGDNIIVGACLKKVGENEEQGKAYIFHRNGSSWTQQAMLIASDGAAGDKFGSSVSISGNHAIVGAYHKDVGGNVEQGKAYIFHYDGTSWTQQVGLNDPNEANYHMFGKAVSIDGDYAIVGSVAGSIEENGQAYIFHRLGAYWIKQAVLTASDGVPYDFFGSSVSIDGDYAIVGAFFFNGENSGKAYIYHRSGGLWTQQAILTPQDGAHRDWFGRSVSIDGDYAIVGASYKILEGNEYQGKAYVFHRSGTIWTQQAGLTASDGAEGDRFGCSVSISGAYTIVGAYNKDGIGKHSLGKVYFFKKY